MRLPPGLQAKCLELAGEGTAAKPQKYGARGFRDDDGTYWHSRKEFARWKELKALEAGGAIRDLKRGKGCRLRLEVNGVLIGHYTPDAVYVIVETGETVIEDTKGFRNREYLRTRKLVKAIHGIDIHEV